MPPKKPKAAPKATPKHITINQHIAAHSPLGQALIGIWNVVRDIALAVYELIKLVLGFVKGILLGSAALLAAVAILIFAAGFLLKAVGISESASFQESRDLWITAKNMKLDHKLHKRFEELQAVLPEPAQYKGELPSLVVPKSENEEKLQQLMEYLAELEEEVDPE